MNKDFIIPAILTDSLDLVKKQLSQANEFANRVQVDIIDGLFVDNLTIDVADLRDVDIYNLKLDIHLMTEYPIELLGECHSIKTDRVFGQIERMGSQEEFVLKAKELGIRSGLALDLYTPVSSFDGRALLQVDSVLLMSVKAGFQGQSFQDSVLSKIDQLRATGYQGSILMDGGMDLENINKCRSAGATEFAIGGFLWKSESISSTFEKLLGL